MKRQRRRFGARLRLALLKPDFGVVGGFERVVDHVETTLRNEGHDVNRITVDVDALPRRPFDLSIPSDVWGSAPEYFRYLASIEAFERINTRRFDVVVSTQPPSFANDHPRHLSLFFHHHRIFYDLEDLYLRAGFSADSELHRRAAAHVRELDQPILERVGWFLAGSEAVRTRLARFNAIDRVGLFHAAPWAAPWAGPRAGTGNRGTIDGGIAPGAGAVLCVGRHEFPKRTELFVHAMKYLPGRRGAAVGSGGRQAWAEAIDRRLSQPGVDLDAVTAEDLWCNTGQGPPPPFRTAGGQASNVTFLGRIDDAAVDRLYREAPCVVAPAHGEDYGLTAVEAMRHGTPVVVCSDGGGLATLVTSEVDGLVVAPDGAAVAGAVERIAADPAYRRELSAGARATAARISWERADHQFRAGLAEVAG